ncbi:uncharacterized protein [Diadema setosum]|uniref:uncharacterized protein n=1 Tax=Diadema setosum TaxID=31175 RepID=UPI003B3A4DA3
MSQDAPRDLEALDSLFSKYGQGASSSRSLSESRKKEIISGAGYHEEDTKSSHTQDTIKSLLDFHETVPDREVDEFVTKIRDTRLLDDYPDGEELPGDSDPTPAFNPWPLDDDSPSPAMADPLSGEIVVTDLQTSQSKPEKEDAVAKETKDAKPDAQDDVDATLSVEDDDDDDGDEDAVDLSEDFAKGDSAVGGPAVDEKSSSAPGDHHGNAADKEEGDGDDWEMIPRVDDDVDLKKPVSDLSAAKEDATAVDDEDDDDEEEKEEEEEGEKEDTNAALKKEEDEVMKEGSKTEDEAPQEEEKQDLKEKQNVENKSDTDADMVDIDVDSRTEKSDKKTDSDLDPKPEDASDSNKSAALTETDGMPSKPVEKSQAPSKVATSPGKKHVPDFETFLAEMGLDPIETLDNEAQKSRARLSRVGPLAQRRPITKRFSGGEEEKWMFVDSTEPRPKKNSIDEEEEEDEASQTKSTPPEPASKPGMGGRRPPGGIGLGPMILPVLGAGLGAAKLKKTPASTPSKSPRSSLEGSSSSEVTPESRTTPPKLAPVGKKVLPIPTGKPSLQTRPKPTTKPRPESQALPAKEPSKPAWLTELKKKPRPVSEVPETRTEVKEAEKKGEKAVNSDILHPKEEAEPTTPKTPSWLANGNAKKLPPIPSTTSPRQEDPAAKPSVPAWKQELMNKKKAIPPPTSEHKTLFYVYYDQEDDATSQPPSPRGDQGMEGRLEAQLERPRYSPASWIGRRHTVCGHASHVRGDRGAAPPIEDFSELAIPIGSSTDDDILMSASFLAKLIALPSAQKPSQKTPIKPPAKPAAKPETLAPPSKSPAKPPIARKPGLQKGTSKDVESSKEEEEEEKSKDETDSKKLKLSEEEETEKEDEKMEVDVMTTGQKEEPAKEEEEETAENDVEMKEEEENSEVKEDEEVKRVKSQEVKGVTIIRKTPPKKEGVKTEERKVKIVRKSDAKNEKSNEKQGDVVKTDRIGPKGEKLGEKPVIIIPKPDVKKGDVSKVKSGEQKASLVSKEGSKKEEKKEEKAKTEERKVTIVTKSDPQKKGEKIVTKTEEIKKAEPDSMPKWKREALERKQKRKMSAGNALPKSPLDPTIATSTTNGNNNVPQWKKDLMEKKKLIPRLPSFDREEKGSVESNKSEKGLKRHTIAADLPTINIPPGQKTGTPSWKQELEKKNARLAKHLANKDAGPEIKSSGGNVENVTTASS